ncbi:hypothetical protein [Bacillus sp. FJAT-49736]|uniref:hypothetical protein n=1 Tax=Bacillus sp. FJAT-49736 TaxID=2833582 RepID=UPI001BC9917F|nr:hypothetical protein [Bacillus sp. FJAT-49736]MBS4173251.1 hypothetical protein [Bacillus sp. FJAT-49736]
MRDSFLTLIMAIFVKVLQLYGLLNLFGTATIYAKIALIIINKSVSPSSHCKGRFKVPPEQFMRGEFA